MVQRFLVRHLGDRHSTFDIRGSRAVIDVRSKTTLAGPDSGEENLVLVPVSGLGMHGETCDLASEHTGQDSPPYNVGMWAFRVCG
jgi:hypothetical protein